MSKNYRVTYNRINVLTNKPIMKTYKSIDEETLARYVNMYANFCQADMSKPVLAIEEIDDAGNKIADVDVTTIKVVQAPQVITPVVTKPTKRAKKEQEAKETPAKVEADDDDEKLED